MGNDGGTIPTRREILDLDNRNYKRQESQALIDKSNRQNNWQYCKISSNKLIKGQVVSDYKGNLFNKESIIEYLIKRQQLPNFEHINSINDVVDLTNFDQVGAEAGSDESFCYLVPCGDIIKSDLIKELLRSSETLYCPVCNQKTLQRDVIEINSNNQNGKFLETRNAELDRLGLHHNLEKRKKRKKKRKQDNKDDDDKKKKKNKT